MSESDSLSRELWKHARLLVMLPKHDAIWKQKITINLLRGKFLTRICGEKKAQPRSN